MWREVLRSEVKMPQGGVRLWRDCESLDGFRLFSPDPSDFSFVSLRKPEERFDIKLHKDANSTDDEDLSWLIIHTGVH